MAFTPTYSEDDLAPSVIDTLVKVVVGVGFFGVLIGLLVGIGVAWAFAKKVMK